MRKENSINLLCVTVVVLMAVAVTVTYAASADEPSKRRVREEVAEAVQAIKDYSVEQRDKAIEKAETALEDLDALIERMEDRMHERWTQMDQSARQQIKATMETLRRQRNELAEWYGGLQYGSTRAWERVKKGFLDSYKTLSDAFDDAEDALTPSSEKDTTSK